MTQTLVKELVKEMLVSEKKIRSGGQDQQTSALFDMLKYHYFEKFLDTMKADLKQSPNRAEYYHDILDKWSSYWDNEINTPRVRQGLNYWMKTFRREIGVACQNARLDPTSRPTTF